MEKKNALYLAAAFTAATSFVGEINAARPGKEKCYGAALKGKNDCGAKDKSHGCAGQAPDNCSYNEWIYVEKALCKKARESCRSEAGLDKKGKKRDHDRDDGSAGALSVKRGKNKAGKKEHTHSKVMPKDMTDHGRTATVK